MVADRPKADARMRLCRGSKARPSSRKGRERCNDNAPTSTISRAVPDYPRDFGQFGGLTRKWACPAGTMPRQRRRAGGARGGSDIEGPLGVIGRAGLAHKEVVRGLARRHLSSDLAVEAGIVALEGTFTPDRE